MRSTLSLAAGALLAGVCLGNVTATAAPAMPQPGLLADGLVEQARTTRAERRQRRMNTMRHGNPNAKFPARRGYQQNLGNTTGGPRF